MYIWVCWYFVIGAKPIQCIVGIATTTYWYDHCWGNQHRVLQYYILLPIFFNIFVQIIYPCCIAHSHFVAHVWKKKKFHRLCNIFSKSVNSKKKYAAAMEAQSESHDVHSAKTSCCRTIVRDSYSSTKQWADSSLHCQNCKPTSSMHKEGLEKWNVLRRQQRHIRELRHARTRVRASQLWQNYIQEDGRIYIERKAPE